MANASPSSQESKQVEDLSSSDIRSVNAEDKTGTVVSRPSTSGQSIAHETTQLLDDNKQSRPASYSSQESRWDAGIHVISKDNAVELELATAPSTSEGSNAEERIPLSEVKVPFLIAMSMVIAGLWCSCGCPCDSLNSTDNGRDYLSKAEVWSPTEARGPKTTGAEQRRETHGQHQEDHHGCHQGCCKWKFLYKVLCIISSSALTTFFLSDIFSFLIYTKLESQYLLDTASFLCLNFQTFSIIIYTTFIRLKLCCRRFYPDFNALPYDMDTCVRRVTLVQAFYNTSGKCYLKSRCSLAIEILVFFLFPLLNAFLQIAFGFLVFSIGCESNWQMATVIIKSVLYLYYGCFWYVVYVQRVYLKCQLNNAIDTIIDLAGEIDCEGARRLIDSIYSEFHVVRYFTGWLMAFTLLTVTFHALCCAIFSYCKSSMVTSRDIYLLLMLWIQNIMFFAVPVCAIGGINLESLWIKFRHVLIKCKVHGQIEFWNEVWSYVTQIDTLASFPLVWTGLFPIFGTILAEMFLRRDSISLEYWSHLSNCTNANYAMESKCTCPSTCMV